MLRVETRRPRSYRYSRTVLKKFFSCFRAQSGLPHTLRSILTAHRIFPVRMRVSSHVPCSVTGGLLAIRHALPSLLAAPSMTFAVTTGAKRYQVVRHIIT